MRTVPTTVPPAGYDGREMRSSAWGRCWREDMAGEDACKKRGAKETGILCCVQVNE